MKKYSKNTLSRFMKSIFVFMLELIYSVRINTSEENYDADYEAIRI